MKKPVQSGPAFSFSALKGAMTYFADSTPGRTENSNILINVYLIDL